MKKLIPVTIYSVAMGYLESAVVIYIREMAFGNATQVFPLRPFEPRLAVLEVVREVATIVMLAMVGYLAGKERHERWLVFIYSFAVWDIVYYAVLRITVGWPASLLTPDVLFLIPVAWIGPVIAPIMIALLLAAGSLFLLSINSKSPEIHIGTKNLWFFIGGCAPVLYSFAGKIFHILLYEGPKGLENYTPKTFDWVPFVVGYLVMLAAVVRTIIESYHKMRSDNPTLGS